MRQRKYKKTVYGVAVRNFISGLGLVIDCSFVMLVDDFFKLRNSFDMYHPLKSHQSHIKLMVGIHFGQSHFCCFPLSATFLLTDRDHRFFGFE